MDLISNLLQVWPLTAFQFSVLYALMDQSFLGLLFTVIGYPLTALINKGLKLSIDKFIVEPKIPNKSSFISNLFLRPKPIGKDSLGCGYFNRCITEEVSYKIGFPSGHAQASIMIATFWSLILYSMYANKKDTIIDKTFMYLGMIFLFIIAFAVCFQRVIKGCHNSLQIGIGSIIGLILGVGLYYFIKFIMYYISHEDTYDKIYSTSMSFAHMALFIGVIAIMILIITLATTKFQHN